MSDTSSDAPLPCRASSRAAAIALFALMAAMFGALVHQCAYGAAFRHYSSIRWAEDARADALFTAVQGQEWSRVTWLLKRGADVNARDGSDLTPLIRAVMSRDAGMCRVLLDHGADVNAKTWLGTTALMVAVQWDQEQLVRLLLARGATVDARSQQGRTALMIACANGDDDLAALLIEAGADANATSKAGDRPIIDAAGSATAQAPALVRRLMAAGAEVDAADGAGNTAFTAARKSESPHLREVLLALRGRRTLVVAGPDH